MSLCIIPDYTSYTAKIFCLSSADRVSVVAQGQSGAHPFLSHQKLLYVGFTPIILIHWASALAALSFAQMFCKPLKLVLDLDCKGSIGKYNALRQIASPKYCLHDSDPTDYEVELMATVEIKLNKIRL